MNSKLEYRQTDAEWYPASRVATTLGYKWVVPILYTLYVEGEIAFVELRNNIEVSNKMLSDTLSMLVEEGYVSRRDEPGNRTYYSLKVDPGHLIVELKSMDDKL